MWSIQAFGHVSKAEVLESVGFRAEEFAEVRPVMIVVFTGLGAGFGTARGFWFCASEDVKVQQDRRSCM